jgi:hypothetical protein
MADALLSKVALRPPGGRSPSGVLQQPIKRPGMGTRALVTAVVLLAAGSPQSGAAADPPAEPVFKVVSPVGDSTAKATAMAPRLDTLAGKTVGLVWNRSFKADVTLPAIGEELKKRYPGVKIVPYDALPVAPQPDPPEAPGKESAALQAAFKAKGCDAVIAGNGG